MVTCRKRVLGVSVAAVVLIALLWFNFHLLEFGGLRAFLDESNLDEHPRFGPQHHDHNANVESSNSTSSQSTTTSAPPVQTSSADTPDKVIVIASTQSDDTAWVGENFPEYVL
jgi:hypothetical protein